MKKLPLSGDDLRALFERIPRTTLIIAVAVIGAAAIALITLNMLRGDHASASQTAWNAAYEELADEMAQILADSLEPYADAVREIATDGDVRAVLQTHDQAGMDNLAERIQPPLAGVLRLRLLPAAIRDPQLEARPPLTFASISMLRKAREDRRVPAAEVHLVGHEDEHLVLMHPVEIEAAPAASDAAGDDANAEAAPAQLLGFVHLSVNPDNLRQILEDGAPSGIFAEIRQGARIRIASFGTESDGGAPSTLARIGGTSMSVKYTARGTLPAAEQEGVPTLVIVAGVALVVGLLVGGVFYFSQRQGVRVASVAADTIIYQGAIKAIFDGAHPGLEQLMPGAKAQKTDFDVAALDETIEGDIAALSAASSTVDDPTIPGAAGKKSGATEAVPEVPASIFRSYDIRGIVGETLTEEGVYQIGRALGAEADARGQKTVVVARDGRHSSEPFLQALSRGLLESGREVLDIGLAPTPVLYFATHHLDARSGVMITGSHNPAEYNGLKIVLDGETLSGDAIQAIRRRVETQDFIEGTGSMQSTDIIAEYIRRISEDIPVTLGNALKVVVDCGNGVPGTVAPDILRAIGHDVIELFCDVDGDFPNHHPDPSQPENLQALIDTVADEGADLGLAFDGDGDRLGVVDSEGNVIWPDRQMILFSRDILSRNPGAKIIYDVKCSRLLAADITAHGGEPIMTKTGHSLIKTKMQETGALLAGEMSGHIFFKERWYGFDDALYSAARLLEILVNSSQSPAELFADLPSGVVTPELRLDMPEEAHQEFMQKVLDAAKFDDGAISTIDGLRVDFPDSWGLVRASNTTPCLVLRFEGDDAAALASVQERFRELLIGIDASLSLPF
jgi:phosphomannomutase / phosphoglucomutase